MEKKGITSTDREALVCLKKLVYLPPSFNSIPTLIEELEKIYNIVNVGYETLNIQEEIGSFAENILDHISKTAKDTIKEIDKFYILPQDLKEAGRIRPSASTLQIPFIKWIVKEDVKIPHIDYQLNKGEVISFCCKEDTSYKFTKLSNKGKVIDTFNVREDFLPELASKVRPESEGFEYGRGNIAYYNDRLISLDTHSNYLHRAVITFDDEDEANKILLELKLKGYGGSAYATRYPGGTWGFTIEKAIGSFKEFEDNLRKDLRELGYEI